MKPALRQIRIDLGYDGTDFYGSQRQPNRRTVQLVVEQALQQVSGRDVNLAFAGRTDRRVHAVGQVASGSIRWRRDDETLRYALDSLTPDDVSIGRVREVEEAFHARFSARSRVYRYRIWNGPVPPVLLKRYAWHVRNRLDLAALRVTSELLVGRHDYSSFAGAGVGVPESPVDCTRTVTEVDWRVLTNEWERDLAGAQLLEFEIRADGFLPHMVRNIVGNLVEVGRGLRSHDWFASVFAERNRRYSEAPAPPHGLVLWGVEYPE